MDTLIKKTECIITAQGEKIESESNSTCDRLSSPGTSQTNSLGIIAIEYEKSESEDENVESEDNIKDASLQVESLKDFTEYRAQPKLICLSDSEDSEEDSTSSDSRSSSSSSSDSESSESNVNSLKSDNSENEDDAVSDDNNHRQSNKSKTSRQKEKGEFDDLPPIEDLKISVPEVLCDPMGEVAWTVEQMVIVRPKPGKPTLNLDTVLFLQKGQRVLGRVFDVFGKVCEPHYCVRFNSSDHIKENEIKTGMTVYYCPNTPYTSLVFLHELAKIKGTDAGDDEHPEFSDDEEERAYYASLDKEKKTQQTSSNDVPCKRKRMKDKNDMKSMWKSKHPWNRSFHSVSYNSENNTTQTSYSQKAHYQNWSRFPVFNSGPYQQYSPRMPMFGEPLYGAPMPPVIPTPYNQNQFPNFMPRPVYSSPRNSNAGSLPFRQPRPFMQNHMHIRCTRLRMPGHAPPHGHIPPNPNISSTPPPPPSPPGI